MRDSTGLKDETGAEILSGDNCWYDPGYAHKLGFKDGIPGYIEQDINFCFWFVSEHLENKVPLEKIHSDLQIAGKN